MTPEIAVLLKAPRPGGVKTRLGREIGPGPAALVYRRLAERTVAAARATGWPVSIWYAPIDAAVELAEWLGEGVTYRPQSDGDLGSRMAAASAGAPGTRIVLIGGDCPRLTTDLLRQAAAAMDRAAVVLGPAQDGGYYLLAGCRPFPDLFTGMPWSTDAVLPETRLRLVAAGIAWEELDVLQDVDTAADASATGWLT